MHSRKTVALPDFTTIVITLSGLIASPQQCLWIYVAASGIDSRPGMVFGWEPISSQHEKVLLLKAFAFLFTWRNGSYCHRTRTVSLATPANRTFFSQKEGINTGQANTKI